MMKKSFFFTLLLLSFYSLNAQNFQWAKSYSGQDGFNDGNSKSNKIYNSAFDSQGNIYILGRFGVGASIDDEYLLTEARLPSNVLAKLDSNGNLLWKKVISNTHLDIQVPHWMEIVGDTSVAIMTDMLMPSMPNNYIYYLDTLVYGPQTVVPQDQWQLPFYPGSYTCFFQFDLDGNLEKEHFLQWNEVDSNNNVLAGGGCFSSGISGNVSPFHIDRDGNIYIITLNQWLANTYTYRIKVARVDRQGQNISYNSLHRSVDLSYKIFKFTPNFDLLWHKDIFMDTIGGCSEYEFWTQLTGISTDEEDNIYLTGTIHNIFEPTSICQTTSPYVLEFRLDSSHSVKIKDRGYIGQGFIIKYDTSGLVKWVNQTHLQTSFEYDNSGGRSNFYNSIVDSTSIYALISAGNSSDAQIYIDSTTQLSIYRNSLYRVAFIRYNKESGDYISHGIVPSDYPTSFSTVAKPSITVKNNHVFAQAEVNSTSSNNIEIVRWLDNGDIIDTINISSTSNSLSLNAGQTILDNNGNLFLTGKFNNSITLGETTLFGSGSNSAAFFAKYHDPTFSVPYRIEDVNLKEGNTISIYPNPTKDKTTIFSNEENIKHITVYNMRGQIIFQRNNLNTNQTNIDLSINSNGIYVIKVVTDKTVYSNKIILTK